MGSARISLRGPLTAAPLVATVVLAWAMLEDPVAWRTFVAVAVLALVPALPVGASARIGACALAALAALAVSFGTWPHEALGDAWTALHDAPAVRAPFDPVSYPLLHGLVAIAAFGLALAATLAAVTRRTPLVVAAVAVGIGFPARLLQDVNALTLGALALGAVLWALLAPDLRGARRAAPGIAIGAAVLVVAVTAASAGVSPSDGRVDWRGWDPFAGGGRTASLRYVWDSNYEGIDVSRPSDRRAARPRAEAG